MSSMIGCEEMMLGTHKGKCVGSDMSLLVRVVRIGEVFHCRERQLYAVLLRLYIFVQITVHHQILSIMWG